MRTRFFLLLLFLVGNVSAQSFEEYRRQALSDFDSYKAEEIRKFKAYRDKVNAEYAEYMRRAWSEYKALPADPVPPRPEPPKPVVKDPDTKPSNDPIPFDNILPMPAGARSAAAARRAASRAGEAGAAVVLFHVLRHTLHRRIGRTASVFARRY